MRIIFPMARAIWRGAIGFGMVAIPMKLYIATESKDISFVTLHASCNTRLRQKRWCSYHETEVE
ncbi:MAG: Ku protein, partial [Dehalococcoidia bacterium]